MKPFRLGKEISYSEAWKQWSPYYTDEYRYDIYLHMVEAMKFRVKYSCLSISVKNADSSHYMHVTMTDIARHYLETFAEQHEAFKISQGHEIESSDDPSN